MTSIGELLGEEANEIVRDFINIGDVHILPLNQLDGITPKDTQSTRDKFFIVLGFNDNGDIIGGIVINSKINRNLPTSITDYLMPVTNKQLTFLSHNSFVNCSHLITVKKNKFDIHTWRGKIDDPELFRLIIESVIECPYTNNQQLKEFGIIK